MKKRSTELILRAIDHTLSASEASDLRERLEKDQLVVDDLVETAVVSDLLTKYVEPSQGRIQGQLFEDFSRINRGVAESTRLPRQKSMWSVIQNRKVLSSTALSLVVLVTAVTIMSVSHWSSGGRGPSSTPSVARELPVIARVSRSVNVEWGTDVARWSVGDVLRQNDLLNLASGRMELHFDCGAVMTIVAPALVELHTQEVVKLHYGTATTRLIPGHEADQFRVLTPSTEVVDLGTEFGVRTQRTGETDVVVFDGAVDLRPLSRGTDKSFSPRRLSIGEAVRTDGKGVWHRLMAIDDKTFPFGSDIYDVEERRPSVIRGISDDRRSSESPSFYRICHGGLAEDARAFVDRSYQWNGLTKEGLPYFLRGADYIQTFNDDKEIETPRIAVELAGPAMLYVFYDDRLVVPDWLRESFEDTGFDIGLDEGSREPNKSFEGIAVGPGNSIDYICSVWGCYVEQPSIVQLGRIGESTIPPILENRTMLGIAARSLSGSADDVPRRAAPK